MTTRVNAILHESLNRMNERTWEDEAGCKRWAVVRKHKIHRYIPQHPSSEVLICPFLSSHQSQQERQKECKKKREQRKTMVKKSGGNLDM